MLVWIEGVFIGVCVGVDSGPGPKIEWIYLMRRGANVNIEVLVLKQRDVGRLFRFRHSCFWNLSP